MVVFDLGDGIGGVTALELLEQKVGLERAGKTPFGSEIADVAVCHGGSDELVEKGRVEISAKKMSYEPEGKTITFSGACLLKAREVKMTSQTIKIHLNEGQEEMQNFLATGKVIIAQQQSEGRGEEAQFDLENETIVLLGNPVLIDKDKGRTEGDKLTFFLADDRITVENQGQERSFTVIK